MFKVLHSTRSCVATSLAVSPAFDSSYWIAVAAQHSSEMVFGLRGELQTSCGCANPIQGGNLMKNIFRGAVVLAAVFFCYTSVHANSIPTKTNSSYGTDEPSVLNYTSVTNVNDLVGGTLVVDATPPAGFDEEIVCPFSTGCVVGSNDSALFLQVLAPTAGEQIVLNFGTGVSVDAVSLLTCDPTLVSGTYCLAAAPSGCNYNYTPGATSQSVTITLPTTAGCTPANLVFSIDEDVAVGSSPSFASVGPNVTAPEPASLGLLAAGMLPLFGFSLWRSRKQRSRRMLLA